MGSNYKYSVLGDKVDLHRNSSNSIGIIGRKKPGWSVVRIPFRHLARLTVSLPLIAFLFCIFWALYSDFESATSTHCNVNNYLPSVSAAFGGFPLSEFIWRLAIGLHAIPRFTVAGIYYRYLCSVLYHQYIPISFLTCCLNVLENLGLIGLTYVSSTENYNFHASSFVMFIFCSTIYMILLSILLKFGRNIPPTDKETKSLQTKSFLVLIYICSLLLALYSFNRHNNYCEPGMYTFFAFFEYIVILSNMGFHMTAYWDFYDRILTIDLWSSCKKISKIGARLFAGSDNKRFNY